MDIVYVGVSVAPIGNIPVGFIRAAAPLDRIETDIAALVWYCVCGGGGKLYCLLWGFSICFQPAWNIP